MVLTRLLQLTSFVAAMALTALPSSVQANPSDILLDNIDGGLTKSDLDTIMSLVSIAENSNTQWWTNYNYCEDIGDGRGFTVSLVGFCSGTGDLLEVVKDVKSMSANHPLTQFLPALLKVNGSPSHDGLGSLCSTIKSNGDSVWKKAVWNGIQNDYLSAAVDWAAKHKLTTVFSKGFLFDVALNHGAGGLDQIAKYVKQGVQPPSQGGDETTYMQAYIQARIYVVQKVDSSTNSGQADRMLMWKSVLDKNNLSLQRPIKATCYGEQFTIKPLDGGETGNDAGSAGAPATETPTPTSATKSPSTAAPTSQAPAEPTAAPTMPAASPTKIPKPSTAPSTSLAPSTESPASSVPPTKCNADRRK